MSFLSPTKSFPKTTAHSIHYSRKSSKRGISEIIGALILLAVTVTGGLLVFVIVQSSDGLTFVTAERESLNPNVIPKLKLSGYDTRDAANLYGILEIDNQRLSSSSAPDFLCAASCTSTTSDNEFVILRVRNDANIPVEITGIVINEVEHTFHAEAVDFDNNFGSGTLPDDGEYSIISGFGIEPGLKQESLSFLPEASEKRLVIRLHNSVTDITLNSNLRVVINSSVETTQLLIVPAGSLI